MPRGASVRWACCSEALTCTVQLPKLAQKSLIKGNLVSVVFCYAYTITICISQAY